MGGESVGVWREVKVKNHRYSRGHKDEKLVGRVQGSDRALHKTGLDIHFLTPSNFMKINKIPIIRAREDVLSNRAAFASSSARISAIARMPAGISVHDAVQ